MSSRKKKKKKPNKKKRPRPLMPGFAHPNLPNTLMIESPPGAEKMSDVLMDFVEPFAGEWRTEEELKKALSVAVIVWNATLTPEKERAGVLQSMVEMMPPEARPAFRHLIDEMIRRKIALFGSIKRFILDFTVTPTPNGPYVQVVSTLDPPIGSTAGGP